MGKIYLINNKNSFLAVYLTAQDIDLQKIQVLESSYSDWFSFKASLTAGIAVGVSILIATMQYQHILDIFAVAFSYVILYLAFAYLLYDMKRDRTRHLRFVNSLFIKIEKGDKLPSIKELRKQNKDNNHELIESKSFHSKNQPNSEGQPSLWIASKSEIIEDFEETRRCLLNNYHSYVQTHAGYLIALIIGFFAVISAFKDFFSSEAFGILWLCGIPISIPFYAIIITISVVSGYAVLRIIYWSTWASQAIIIPVDEAIQYFNEENKKEHRYLTKAPNTVVIQWGIKHIIKMNLDKFGFFRKRAMKTARKSF